MNLYTLHLLNEKLQQALQAQKLERISSVLREMEEELIDAQAREAKEDIKRRIRLELAKKESV